MTRTRKTPPFHIFALACAALILLLSPAASATNIVPQTKAKQAIVYDVASGQVLFEKNADEQMPTSSMSKVMSMYVVFDALKNGTLHLNDTFSVSEDAWRKGGSKMFVEVGKQVKVEDLIRGVIIQSGNDATIVLAEGIAGSEFAFADILNQKAQKLGMTNSHFVNASGWPDPEHYSSARDLAILGAAVIQDFPEYYHYYSEKEFTYNDIKQGNRNPLLYRNIGADGIKTGHTEIAGYGLIGSGVYKERRIVIVINGLENEQERADEGANLLEWGLKNFVTRPLFKAGGIVTQAPVAGGKAKAVDLISHTDIAAVLHRTGMDDLKVQAKFKSPIIAPVKKGDELGMLIVQPPGLQEKTYPLYAAQDIAKKGWIMRTIGKAARLLNR